MIKQWSITRYKDWKKCPAYAKFKHVQKIAEEAGPAAARGTAIHKQCENYINREAANLSDIHSTWLPMLESIRCDSKAEYKIALTKDWKLTDWFASNCWGRVVIDAAIFTPTSIRVIDFKTGKMRDDYAEQVELYAITGTALQPAATEISTELWYLDHPARDGNPVVEKIPADLVPALKRKWENEFGVMMADTDMVPTPGPQCKWCHFSRYKGGPCPSH